MKAPTGAGVAVGGGVGVAGINVGVAGAHAPTSSMAARMIITLCCKTDFTDKPFIVTPP